ncbi:LOW QUALITY PROTEIN: ciliary microtubule inner protein 5 [Cyanocitta cristata]
MVSLKTDKLERGSGFRRNTLIRSQQRATTPPGQPAPAPSVSTAPSQAELTTTAQLATWAWADEQADQVQQDKIESVEAERRGRKTCFSYENRNSCKREKRKEQKLLPNYMSVFSSKVPNSTNQIIGNQMNTELGRALVNINYFFSSGAQKRKLEGELQLS